MEGYMVVKIEKTPPSGYKAKGDETVKHPTGAEVSNEVVSNGVNPPGNVPGEAPKMLAYPSVRIGQTLNLGNYNSLRVEVGLSVPVDVGGDNGEKELADSYDFALAWVDERLTRLITDAREAYGVK